MAAEVQPLAPIRVEEGPAPLTADQAYWRSFKNQLLVPSPHNGAVTSITAGGSDTFAVTSGARVQIYNSRTRKLVKTITRFNVDDTARSGVLRRDGRILLAGGDSGIMQAFDTGSRAILRQWGHNDKRRQPVHCIRWSLNELTEFMTCGDDRTVRVWDLTEDQPKWVGRGHEDYVRCGVWLPGQTGLLVSGSYDQTVRLWDSRTTSSDGEAQSRMTFRMSNAVEDVLALNSSLVAAAAGNTVAILNLVAGKPDAVLRSHQKTVTRLASAQNGSRLLTAALDGHIKIHSTESWEVVASLKYTDPILALAVISFGNDERHLAIGLQTGLLSLRTRIAGAEKVKVKEKEKRMQAMIAGTADEYDRQKRKKDTRQGIRARDRGKDFAGESADIVIVGNEKNYNKKLKGWQQSLRSTSYAKALDQTLTTRDDVDNIQVVTLLTALRHRSALRAALSDRSEERLIPVLDWVRDNIAHPRYVHLVADVLLLILDIYSYKFAEWAESESDDQRKVVSIISKITARVRRNAENAEKAEGVLGMLSLLTAGG